MWGKKRAKSDKGKPIKKYYIKSEEKHYIWVKWKNPFSDKPDIVWSAEPQCKNKGTIYFTYIPPVSYTHLTLPTICSV